jgi:hypothetical protein
MRVMVQWLWKHGTASFGVRGDAPALDLSGGGCVWCCGGTPHVKTLDGRFAGAYGLAVVCWHSFDHGVMMPHTSAEVWYGSSRSIQSKCTPGASAVPLTVQCMCSSTAHSVLPCH